MLLELMLFLNTVTAGLPDSDKFKPVLFQELEFRINDYQTAFVGKVVTYQNLDDPNEFVKVYYRQVPLISERAKERGNSENSRDIDMSNMKYHDKQESEALLRTQKAVDGFAYVHWRVTKDARSGEDIRVGPIQTGLLSSEGEWTHYIQNGYSAESALMVSPLSNLSESGVLIIGLKFSLEETEHILLIDEDDIAVLPKKGEGNEK